MTKILFLIKRIVPKPLFKKIQPGYHLAFNFLAALVYGFPSNRMIVVGITGTTGKTTVTYMTAELLKSAGLKVGYTSTAMFSDGEKEWLNDKKMTMLGRFFTQKMLRQMVKNKCDVAIVETTSEGIVQNRHRFINYDIVEFTGLYPEHIDSHGSFENYKNAKLKLFEHIEKCKMKKIQDTNYKTQTNPNEQILNSKRKDDNSKLENSDFNQNSKFKIQNCFKTIIVNLDDEYAEEFLDFEVEGKIGFFDSEQEAVNSEQENPQKFSQAQLLTPFTQGVEKVQYKFLEMNKVGTKFVFDNEEIQLNILGDFNALNATATGCVGKALDIDNEKIKKGLEKIKSLPGRLERIDEEQNFTVIVDYAFEPVAVTKLYETVSALGPNKIIHVLGSTGGGRDISRRSELGKIAGEKADYVIVTNEDPYDDDPMKIIKDVAEGSEKAGKVKDKNLFFVEDRQDGIKKAISLAQENDVVLITGKGSEQAIAGPNGKLTPWDDRAVVREALKK